jgi:hypothetical protein
MAATPGFWDGRFWNTVNVVTPVVLKPGSYWIAFTSTANNFLNGTLYGTSSGELCYAASGFDMPAVFPSCTMVTQTWQVYGTFLP